MKLVKCWSTDMDTCAVFFGQFTIRFYDPHESQQQLPAGHLCSALLCCGVCVRVCARCIQECLCRWNPEGVFASPLLPCGRLHADQMTWARPRCKFFSLTETPEDYTIIVDEDGFKELPQSEYLSVAEATWLALNVVSGGGSATSSQPIGVTKIAKSVIAPLADHNISVFMLSTYQTDFILVRERDLPMVMHTLSSEFTLLRVVNGETVAANSTGVTNGFVKPKLVPRPIIHPLSSPSNMFCVTSLDPDTLPSVATLLMDVMFYSGGVKESGASGDDSGHIRFFSFSLIEGYISLVMDEQTTRRFPNNVLFTSASGELWKMVRIGGQPLGFDECGIVAQISEPLATADIPAYYISTFKFDHALVPEENIQSVIGALRTNESAGH
ncbi:cytosolic arginine sensor for mTORC1 subunit 2 isoform X1 [Alosa pseudoharengus]|uniref:cytosolic arginine sensor for mTORC1 subunit 2 isoform X1 n=1 Tax=Alosa pseudoharengus TaxID=34774 RepID=UPI003F892561